MDKDSVVWIGGRALGCLIPERRLDDPAVHNGEQVVQDLGMQLETWLVKAICTTKQDGLLLEDGKALMTNVGSQWHGKR